MAPTAVTVVSQPCTEADVVKPVDHGMPAPRVLTRRFIVERYGPFLDPPGSATPKVSAETAWRTLTRGASGGGNAQLMLGYLTAQGPTKADHLLAWLLEVRHNAQDVRLSGARGRAVPATDAPAVCAYGAMYAVLDATSGKELGGATGGEQFLFSR